MVRPMKFTIRDLLLVTVIVALVLGWWIDHRRQAELREKAEVGFQTLCSYLTEEGYKLGWDTEKDMLAVSRPGDHKTSADAPIPPKK